MSGTTAAALPSPMATQMAGQTQTSYGQQFSPSRPSASPAHPQHSLPYGSHGAASHAAIPQTPGYQSQQPYSQQSAAATTPVAQHHPAGVPYNQYQGATAVPRAIPQTSVSHGSHNAYNPPRQSEIYTLSETANSAIPTDVRSQFHKDDYGKILFFTTPPLNVDPLPPKSQFLGHSLRYLADKARNKEADEKKRKARADRLEEEAQERVKRVKAEEQSVAELLLERKAKALGKWTEDMEKGTDALYKHLHGENWEEVRKQDLAKMITRQELASKEKKENEAFHHEIEKRDEAKNSGLKWT
jgi:chromatin structure-remodeling complex subunit RSC1/2